MIFLHLYLSIGLAYLVGALINAYCVRDLIDRYPNRYHPEVDAQEKAEAALLVVLTPFWLGVALFFVARTIWSLIQDVRAYYFKANRKEADDR